MKVPLEKTLDGVEQIVQGKCDSWRESDFYMAGDLEEVRGKSNRA
ncbi:MAG TPA: hypothetical protein V6C82_10845 [Chroococcales cyanobacterium]|jgi:F0F1-type ATP synthase beta subunit